MEIRPVAKRRFPFRGIAFSRLPENIKAGRGATHVFPLTGVAMEPRLIKGRTRLPFRHMVAALLMAIGGDSLIFAIYLPEAVETSGVAVVAKLEEKVPHPSFGAVTRRTLAHAGIALSPDERAMRQQRAT